VIVPHDREWYTKQAATQQGELDLKVLADESEIGIRLSAKVQRRRPYAIRKFSGLR
jgi:hypothetical protein